MIPPAKNEFVILGFCVSVYLFRSRARFATESRVGFYARFLCGVS